MNKISPSNSATDAARLPHLWVAILPVVFLLGCLISIMVAKGSDAIFDYSHWTLLAASGLALTLSLLTRTLHLKRLANGLRRSATQILPAIPLLILIAMIAATWLWSGVVPTLIDYGIRLLNPTFFLVVTCLVCAVVSVLTGSSWTTIATIGVAFIGIGRIMGYEEGWIAGAIISGAYFGDKVSPLSDTTVIASSSCGVDLFDHIRFLMQTSIPALLVALIVYLGVGFMTDTSVIESGSAGIIDMIHSVFFITPWTLLIPLVVLVMIAFRVKTLITLAVGTLLGIVGMFIFQPPIFDTLASPDASRFMTTLHILWSETSLTTGMPTLDDLMSTGGITGMLPTVMLVLCAMIFGGVMLGTGMLAVIARAFTSRLSRRRSIVGATVGSGLFLNACTADQYLSIIIGGNMYRDVYDRYSLPPRLLSRTLEDSISVTSVLIPWNSCGVTQSTVLGVATLVYLPFCIFNYLSPLMTLIRSWRASSSGILKTAEPDPVL